MTFHQLLRERTAPLHDEVDAAFGHFRLDDRSSYAAFLRAHAAALLPAEAALEGAEGLPRWRPRGAMLTQDLAALGEEPPPPLAFTVPTEESGRLGLLYVLEGSRLGGSMLLRGVPEGLPHAYLAARHEAGEWRAFLSLLNAAGEDGDAAWRDEAFAGAEAGFALFRRAAEQAR